MDKLPTARVLDRNEGTYLVEVEVYGDGIKMWLLSQGTWVRVVSPDGFVEDMRQTVVKMAQRY